jgi:hypothetical protein
MTKALKRAISLGNNVCPLFYNDHDIAAKDTQQFPLLYRLFGENTFAVLACIPHFQLGVNPRKSLSWLQVRQPWLELRIRLLVL